MTGDRSERGSRSSPSVKSFVLTLLGILAAQLIYGAIVFGVFAQMDVRGQFGDMFGGINALFTGFAFAGVIYTIILQRHELELQRDELRLTREELHTSAEAQKDQVSQLEQAAKLSALTALLNVYSTNLQPLREIIRPIRRDVADYKGRLRNDNVDPDQRLQIAREIEQFEMEIEVQESEWAVQINKHDELVKRLEALVEDIGAENRRSVEEQ